MDKEVAGIALQEPADVGPDDLLTEETVGLLAHAMKKNKAAGIDGIQPEHLKYAGPICLKALTILFNSITRTQFIPPQFKIGVIIPIPKGDKDKALQNNYRGITLQPLISKLYEKSILQKLRSWVRSEGIICDLQGAD